MIFIDKSIVATPDDLLNETHTKANCDLFDLNPIPFNSNTTKFVLYDTYKTDEVKTALRITQGGDENGISGKCAYCEKDLREEAAHVDHFRPQKSVINNNGKRIYPGYYWLAYQWENLYMSCLACNSSYKKDFFPLVMEENRARSHHDSIDDEEPLLIDPGKEGDDPRNHIRFRFDFPESHLDSEKGKKTIEILKLDDEKKRPNLIKDRLKVLNRLITIRRIIENALLLPEELEICKQILLDAVEPSAEYSSMAKDFLDEFLASL